MTMRYRKTAALFSAVLFLLSSCTAESEHTSDKEDEPTQPVTSSFFAMDTYMTITAYGENAQKAADESAERIKQLEALWSVNDDNSDISRLNSNGNAEVDTETSELLSFSLGIGRETGGALDITLYPVLREWGFTTGKYHVPDDGTIGALLEKTGADRVTVNGSSVSLPAGFMVDLGSVAKGRTGDIAADILRKNGVTSALLDLGGNIQTVGRKPDGSKWKIGLKAPNGSGIFGVIETEDCAVVTSGGYERYFEQDGETYWHILDPKTGRPARSGLVSATVIGTEGRLCDALSTAFFVMGEERAAEYLREHDGFEFVLVTDDDRVIISEGLEDSFTSKELFGKTEVIRRGKE